MDGSNASQTPVEQLKEYLVQLIQHYVGINHNVLIGLLSPTQRALYYPELLEELVRTGRIIQFDCVTAALGSEQDPPRVYSFYYPALTIFAVHTTTPVVIDNHLTAEPASEELAVPDKASLH